MVSIRRGMRLIISERTCVFRNVIRRDISSRFVPGCAFRFLAIRRFI